MAFLKVKIIFFFMGNRRIDGTIMQLIVAFIIRKIYIVEKPITLKSEHAEYLYNLAKSKKKKIFVAFQNRYNPSIKRTKKALIKKSFGKIITVSARLRWCRYADYYNDDWHGTWKLDGGVLSNQAIHILDILLWFFGPVKKVFSISKNIWNEFKLYL